MHPQGFEIIGISFDRDKGRLENFLEKEKMDWPQYFGGLGWENKYGINAIPKMWFIDKKGVLRSLNARTNLDAKIKRLMAENASI